MLTTLASVLLLGVVPPPVTQEPARPLPGIELVSVASPSVIAGKVPLPALSASGVLLLDADSGEEIFALNADVRRPMASLTKIMTALLILENHDVSESVTIPSVAEQIGGSTLGIVMGQRFLVGALLRGLLIPSANDAAYALAAFHSRSVGAFVQVMNNRAAALGLTNTHFANPAGLDNEGQYSTPRDLAWLSLAALKNETFRSIVNTRTTRILSADGKEYDLRNTNELLHYNEDVFGVKTGTTDKAGECLIVLFSQENHSYLLVLLGSKERYTDSLNVLQAVRTASL